MAYNQPYFQGGYYPQYQNGAMPDMLNQYKAQYQQMPMQQPMMQQSVQQMPMQMQPTQMSGANDMMIWVLSEVEAQSYPVAPNNSVILWDKNNDVVYIKSVNMQGVPSMRILDYTERNTDKSTETPQKHVCKCGDKFATIDAVNALQSKIEALQCELEELKSKPKTKLAKKTVEEDEENG